VRSFLEKFSLQLPAPTARTFRSALFIAAIAVVLALVMAWRALPKSDADVAPSPSPTEFFDEASPTVASGLAGPTFAPGATAATAGPSVALGLTEPPANLATPTNPATSASSATIFVHVTGEVVKPGVVEIPFGARVVAALEKAGGAKPGQKIENVNLARIAVDGEQIYFGANHTTRPRPASSTAAAPARVTKLGAMPTPAIPAATPSAQQPAKSNLINLNSATATDLELLPGVGPVLAKRIIDFRKSHGGFLNVQGLLEVKGIGDKIFKEISAHVTV
jgi:competence protein ComEA